MKVDHDAVARELVRALRGPRSQVQLARRLGFASNVIYSWESGRRWPTATRFLAVARAVGIAIGPATEGFLRAPLPHEPGSTAWLGAMLQAVRGTTPIGALAERSGCSRFALSRWLAGRADPSLPDLLRVVDAAGPRLLDFVGLFTDPGALPSTRRAHARIEAARDLAWASPWASAVLLALETTAYRALPAHDDAWLAARLDVPEALVADCLERLHRAGHVRRDTHFRPAAVLSVDVRRGPSATELKRHWAEVGLERLGGDGMYSYNLFTVSEATLAAIRELQRAHYRAVRALVAAATDPPDHVVLMNLQLVPLDQRSQSRDSSSHNSDRP